MTRFPNTRDRFALVDGFNHGRPNISVSVEDFDQFILDRAGHNQMSMLIARNMNSIILKRR